VALLAADLDLKTAKALGLTLPRMLLASAANECLRRQLTDRRDRAE
jgi:hypothetical protein